MLIVSMHTCIYIATGVHAHLTHWHVGMTYQSVKGYYIIHLLPKEAKIWRLAYIS